MYAQTVTNSMRTAIHETERRRAIQEAYNQQHGITPQSIVKARKCSAYERTFHAPVPATAATGEVADVDHLDRRVARLWCEHVAPSAIVPASR
jgi:excinuclease ABC subunit B